ncbi:MAG TPA: hypothetical protein PKD37_07100 [Oligoflexia bacterium]|nr:hypothetical protein [Oligoflexia bacterium]HMP27730.1 hypothetical protein [Oligoflexia bacterium]
MYNVIRRLSLLGIIFNISCAKISPVLNPFAEEPAPEALYGERSDRALNSGQAKGDSARKALEAMATYRRAHLPEPVNPVIQPAVVRLMWVPDHLNKNGDLVPQHYYYLKVLNDRWAVTDAFELEGQLQSGSGSSNVPYINANDVPQQ